MKKVFLLFCAMVFFALPGNDVFAQAGDGAPKRVTAVSVSGIKRTRPHVAEYPLRKFIGRETAEINVDEVYAAIMNTGILELLEVVIEDSPDAEGSLLRVTVREKWAFFPMPIITVGSESMSFGGVIMDANAFGLNDKMVFLGAYNPGGWMASVMYTATPDREHMPGWNIMGFYLTEEKEQVDREKMVFRRFNPDTIGGSVGISYPVIGPLTAGLAFLYQNKILRDASAPIRAPVEGAMVVGIKPEISVRHSEWDGYFLSGQTVSLSYTYMIGIGSPSFHSVALRGAYEKSLLPGFRLNIKSGIVYAPSAPVLFESAPSVSGVDILPRNFSAQNYAGMSLGFEKHLFKFSMGALSALAAYQVVWSEGGILGSQFDHGVAGSIRVYLSKLALPAVGLGMSYNVVSEIFQVAFSMGMSM